MPGLIDSILPPSSQRHLLWQRERECEKGKNEREKWSERERVWKWTLLSNIIQTWRDKYNIFSLICVIKAKQNRTKNKELERGLSEKQKGIIEAKGKYN
jgi:hypothetical protein